MSETLNAANFRYCDSTYKNEFENILSGIVESYKMIISSPILLLNDENKIRDEFLLKYLKNETFKKQTYQLANYLFDLETIEYTGRADIRIMPINKFRGDDAYFVIECKRLDNKATEGISGLNAKYITNGICRFVSGYYSSYYSVNGMFGFVVETMNIDDNIKCINSMLNNDMKNDKDEVVNARPTEVLTKTNDINNYQYAYISKHEKTTELTIYHLMFDFSKKLQ